MSQNNAIAIPRDRFLLDRQTKSVIVPPMVQSRPSLGSIGFGTKISVEKDGTQIVKFNLSDTVIKNVCLFIPFPRTFGNFLLYTMTGVARANDAFVSQLPIAVPDDLTVRERQFLSLLDFEQRELIPLPANVGVTMHRALTPSIPYSLGYELPEESGGYKFGAQFYASAATKLNQQSRQHVLRKSPVRLFVSRKDATVRYMLNEDEAFDALRPWGFERVLPTDKTPGETAQLFGNAEIVVGGASSGMLNIAFGPPGSSVIEIDHPINQRIPQALSRALSMRFRATGFIPQQARSREFGNQNYDVNIEELLRVVGEEVRHQENQHTNRHGPTGNP